MIFNILGLKFLNFILELLPDALVDNIPVIETTSDLFNIFAWVDYFIPLETIVVLLSLTAGYYAFRIIFFVIRSTKDILF